MRIVLVLLAAIFLSAAQKPAPKKKAPAAPAKPTVYAAKENLGYQEKLQEERNGVKIFDASYTGIEGGRVNLYAVVPPGKGPFPGIIIQHGDEQSRLTYLSEAVLLAQAGAISFITDVDFPDPDPMKFEQFRNRYLQLVIDLRRALDLMVARPDVDQNRIGYVGHSYGAFFGAMLTAVDKRIKTFVLLGGLARFTAHLQTSDWWESFRKSIPQEKLDDYLAKLKPLDPAEFIGKSAPAPVLFQCASYDEVVTPENCLNLYQTAAEPKQIRWYSSKHDFQDFDAVIDRLKWLQVTLRLAPVGAILQKRLSEK